MRMVRWGVPGGGAEVDVAVGDDGAVHLVVAPISDCCGCAVDRTAQRRLPSLLPQPPQAIDRVRWAARCAAVEAALHPLTTTHHTQRRQHQRRLHAPHRRTATGVHTSDRFTTRLTTIAPAQHSPTQHRTQVTEAPLSAEGRCGQPRAMSGLIALLAVLRAVYE